MSNTRREPLGTTIKFPFELENGGIKIASGVEAVESHMKALVLAEHGSHLMEPGLGWRMKELIPTGDLDQINQAIKQVLIDCEDRIDHSDLDVTATPPNASVMGVVINYSIKNDATRRTLKVDVPVPEETAASDN
jgi:hypothetical protein